MTVETAPAGLGSTTAAPPIVSVRDLAIRFVMRERTVHAVNGVSFDLAPGEVLGILGESGSGKSVRLMRYLSSASAQAGWSAKSLSPM